jgi:16S rRNA (cytidine1402-2'-O)-methyltransferase
MFEETIRETATEVLAHYTNKPPKEEIVVIVDGKK